MGTGKKSRRRVEHALGGSLPILRVSIAEGAEILRMSRALLYRRIAEGAIRVQKDGTRSYLTYAELQRYVESCNPLGRRRSR